MLFEVPELDYMKTKRNVMNVIKRYEMALMRIDIGNKPKITANYNLEVPPSYGNNFHSSTEQSALYGVEGHKSDKNFVDKIVYCVNSLREDYRQILLLSYFMKEPHEIVANKLCISTAKLSLNKRIVIELFAYGMGVEVYRKLSKEDDNNKD